jgi:hypothetical protein
MANDKPQEAPGQLPDVSAVVQSIEGIRFHGFLNRFLSVEYTTEKLYKK